MNTDFNERLRLLRRQSGITQSKMAEILGVGQTAVANYEKGLRFPDEKILIKIADYFSLPLDKLVGREYQPDNTPSTTDGFLYHPSVPLKMTVGKFIENSLRSHNDGIRFILRLLDSGYSEEQIIIDLLITSLKETGKRWAEGLIDEAREHQLSMTVLEALILLKGRAHSHPAGRGRLAGLTATGERHSLGLRMICRLLEIDGWDSYFLGYSVPPGSLQSFIDEMGINLVLISVTMTENSDSALSMVKAAGKASNAPHIIVGGQASGMIARKAIASGADFTASGISELIKLTRELSSGG